MQPEFQDIELQTTVTVLLRAFDYGKIPLPTEVELCLPGFEVSGWLAAATRHLRECRSGGQGLLAGLSGIAPVKRRRGSR